MKILAFETSCDETSCAVIEDGRKILSNVISTQVPIHKKFGGVVPEIASRHHIEDVLPVAIEALEEARAGWEDIDAVAVTQGPGLVGALLVGVAAAKTAAWVLGKPLIAVNHMEGHILPTFSSILIWNLPFYRLSFPVDILCLLLFVTTILLNFLDRREMMRPVKLLIKLHGSWGILIPAVLISINWQKREILML